MRPPYAHARVPTNLVPLVRWCWSRLNQLEAAGTRASAQNGDLNRQILNNYYRCLLEKLRKYHKKTVVQISVKLWVITYQKFDKISKIIKNQWLIQVGTQIQVETQSKI